MLKLKDNSCQTDCQTVSVAIQTVKPVITIEDVENDSKSLMFYTGIPNKETFYALFDELSDEDHLSKQVGKRRELRRVDEFFFVLMRLRLGLRDVAERFCICESLACKIFSAWICHLYVNLQPLIYWPSREQIKATMPRAFGTNFPNCRIVLACTELFVQRPSLISQSLTYSHYKANMTWKALIGITPCGVLSFASDLWLGGISDPKIVLKSGLLDMLESGDAIMGDKGFDISNMTTPKGIELIIPPKRNKQKRMTSDQILCTRRIAAQRIHVERYMSRVKKFRIFNQVSTMADPNAIWIVCNALTVLQPPLNKKK